MEDCVNGVSRPTVMGIIGRLVPPPGCRAMVVLLTVVAELGIAVEISGIVFLSIKLVRHKCFYQSANLNPTPALVPFSWKLVFTKTLT